MSFWTLRYREARAIALIVAIVLWTLAAVFLFAKPGYRSIAGPLKGGDFIVHYVFGAAARAGEPAKLYDYAYLHALQTSILPESAPERYLPVYPPQIFLVYLPLAFLSYAQAAIVWSLAIIAVYTWVVRATWRASRDALPDGTFVAMAAAAFPPFWSLVLHGHNTIVPLLGFFLGWRALARDRRFLAGLAFGLLFFKPQFGLVLAVFVICGREWAMLGGLAVAAGVQLAAVAAAFGLPVVLDYVRFMRVIAPVEYLIEPKPFELHSIRALTRLVPDGLGTILWLGASVVVVHRAWHFWRRVGDAGARVGVLVLATVLVSPHLFLYDATVLALTILLVGAWVERDPVGRTVAAQYWPLVCGLFAAFLLPFARIFFVQVSVLLMIWLLVILARSVSPNPAPLSAQVPSRA